MNDTYSIVTGLSSIGRLQYTFNIECIPITYSFLHSMQLIIVHGTKRPAFIKYNMQTSFLRERLK